MAGSDSEALMRVVHQTVLALVRQDGRDLSARQLSLVLTVYLKPGPHTVRGLAAELNVSKPAISRALDRLGELDLTRRKVDSADRRSVLVQETAAGRTFLAELRGMIRAAANAATASPEDRKAAA